MSLLMPSRWSSSTAVSVALSVLAGASACRKGATPAPPRQNVAAVVQAGSPSSSPPAIAGAATTTIPLPERAAIAARLTYISERDGHREVYSQRPDGTAERRLTYGKVSSYNGPVSPSGQDMLVTSAESEEEGGKQWFSLLRLPPDAAATTPEPLRPLGGKRSILRSPSWSPDGELIFFESNSTGFCDLFSIRRSDGKLTQLTNNPEGNFSPVLSPRGDRLAFISSRDRVAELYLMQLPGGQVQRLTDTPRDEWTPKWSPDGKWLLLGSDRESADRLYLVRFGTATPSVMEQTQRLSTQDSKWRADVKQVEEQAAWSPDSRRLAYVLRRQGEPSQLVIMDLDAQGRLQPLRTLSLGDGRNLREPAFSPDGRYLVFSANRQKNGQLYLARSDGRDPTPLGSAQSMDWNPQWVTPPPATPATKTVSALTGR